MFRLGLYVILNSAQVNRVFNLKPAGFDWTYFALSCTVL